MDSGFRLGGPGMTPVLLSSQAARGHLGQTANGSRGVNSSISIWPMFLPHPAPVRGSNWQPFIRCG